MTATQTLLQIIARRAHETPEALAFDVEDERLTWSALRRAIETAAVALVGQGVGPGDVVGVALPTRASFLAAFFGAQRVGAWPLALNPRTPVETNLRRLVGIEARACVVPAERASDFAAPTVTGDLAILADDVLARASSGSAPPPPPADGVSHLQLTSGTSGAPRVAVLSHANVLAFCASAARRWPLAEDDVFLSWIPPHHDFGLVRFVFWPIYAGRPCHLLEPDLFRLDRWLDRLADARATITGCPDFGFRFAAARVAPAGRDLSALRLAFNGGEPVRETTMAAFEARFGLGHVIAPGYGLAEATLALTMYEPGRPRRCDARGNVSVGRPYDVVSIRIADDHGVTLAANTEGCILATGATVFAGYLHAPEATRAVLSEDGWLDTGDEGYLDDDGHLYVLGRRRAMIKRAGAQVAPREVEEAVDGLAAEVPGLRFSAAVGLPNEALGGTEDVVIVVEVHPERVDAAAVRARVAATCRAVTGVAPGKVLLVAPRTIPRTHNGKIRHQRLRAALLAGEISPV